MGRLIDDNLLKKKGKKMPRKSVFINKGIKLPLLENEADINEYLSVIKYNLLHKEKLIQKLQEQLKDAKDKAYKDKELAAARDAIKEMNEKLSHSFEVTKDEWDAIHKWQQHHGHALTAAPQQPVGLPLRSLVPLCVCIAEGKQPWSNTCSRR